MSVFGSTATCSTPTTKLAEMAHLAAIGVPDAWPILLTREQLCAYLGGLSDVTLRKVCPVPAVDLGANVLRYHRAQIDAWVDSLGPRGLRVRPESEQDAPPAANDAPAGPTPAERARARAKGDRRWKKSNTSSVSAKAG